jgi:hypothetical protein
MSATFWPQTERRWRWAQADKCLKNSLPNSISKSKIIFEPIASRQRVPPSGIIVVLNGFRGTSKHTILKKKVKALLATDKVRDSDGSFQELPRSGARDLGAPLRDQRTLQLGVFGGACLEPRACSVGQDEADGRVDPPGTGERAPPD